MDFNRRRQEVLEKMEANSILILYSGIEVHVSADEYAPFEANRNFFYLTGLRRDKMALVLEEAKEITGIEDVSFIDDLESRIDFIMTREDVDAIYFDTYRHQLEDMEDYNLVKANEFARKYPGTRIKNCYPIIAEMRMQKDADEVDLIRDAIKLTDEGNQTRVTVLNANETGNERISGTS